MADSNILTSDDSTLRASPSAGDPAALAPHGMTCVADGDGNAAKVSDANPHPVKDETARTSLASIDGKMTTLAGLVDGLEVLVAATNTALGTLDGRVDGLESLVTTLNGYADGLETLIGTTNSTLTTVDGRVDGLEALITTLNGYVDTLETLLAAATPAGSNVIGRVGIDQTTNGTTNAVALTATKSGRATLTQLTGSGNTAAAAISTARVAVFTVLMTNGSATITVGATVQPQISYDGTNWVNDGGAFSFSTTASTTEYRTYVPPGGGLPVHSVRFVYTAPTTSGSAASLDVEYATGN